MSQKNVAAAVAVAAITFLTLLVGSRFYEVYALQNPLSQELQKYHISNMQYSQQSKTVVLKLDKESNLRAAVNDISKKFGEVKIELKDKPSDKISNFYNEEELYIMQFIDEKQYGSLRDYLQTKADGKFNVEISVDEQFIYLKISDSNSALFKMFSRVKESEV